MNGANEIALSSRIILRSVASLVPYAKNARTHSPGQIAKIVASIREYGWTNPILLDGENGILAGHARLRAALDLGLTEVPCIDLAHLTPAQRRAYILADNRLALDAGWDEELLAEELAALSNEGYNLDVIGFSDDELAQLLDTDPGDEETSPPPAVPDKAKSVFDYVDVIVRRWQNYTGKQAIHEKTGKSFDAPVPNV